jgi:hypothetical protein
MINVYAGSKPHSICVIYILPKFIEPDARPRPGYSPFGELYNLGRDLGETNNLNTAQPDTGKKLSGELDAEQRAGRAGGQKRGFE